MGSCLRFTLIALSSTLLLVSCSNQLPSAQPLPSSPPQSPTAQTPQSPQSQSLNPLTTSAIAYSTQPIGKATAHIIKVSPAKGSVVRPVVAEKLQPLADFVKPAKAGVAINAGFFDPNNQQTTSYVIINRQTVADPNQNPQLTQNPKLKPYLRQILDRAEFQRYDCNGQPQYRIQSHSSDGPDGCQLLDAIGGGPQLLPELKSQREGFIDPELGRDAIGTQVPNARSAIGITADQTVILVMVAQSAPKTGATLPELAKLLQSLGAETAMNLDGGSSSSLFHNGKTIPGSLNENAQPNARAVKSAIVVAPIS